MATRNPLELRQLARFLAAIVEAVIEIAPDLGDELMQWYVDDKKGLLKARVKTALRPDPPVSQQQISGTVRWTIQGPLDARSALRKLAPSSRNTEVTGFAKQGLFRLPNYTGPETEWKLIVTTPHALGMRGVAYTYEELLAWIKARHPERICPAQLAPALRDSFRTQQIGTSLVIVSELIVDDQWVSRYCVLRKQTGRFVLDAWRADEPHIKPYQEIILQHIPN